jgi:hypothetical protein
MPSVTQLARDVAAKIGPVVTARFWQGWQWLEPSRSPVPFVAFAALAASSLLIEQRAPIASIVIMAAGILGMAVISIRTIPTLLTDLFAFDRWTYLWTIIAAVLFISLYLFGGAIWSRGRGIWHWYHGQKSPGEALAPLFTLVAGLAVAGVT